MRKKTKIVVEGEAAISDRVWYAMTVAAVSVRLRKRQLMVTLQHRGDQEGRVHQLVFSLPVRPSGRSAELLRACGFHIDEGADILPHEAVGRTLEVRFHVPPSGSPEPAAFKPFDGKGPA